MIRRKNISCIKNRCIDLNDACDGLQMNATALSTLRGAVPPSRNNLSHALPGLHARMGSQLQAFVHCRACIALASLSGVPRVRFSSSTDRNYAVEYRADLTTGEWQDLGGVGAEMTVSDPFLGPQRFYRIRIELP